MRRNTIEWEWTIEHSDEHGDIQESDFDTPGKLSDLLHRNGKRKGLGAAVGLVRNVYCPAKCLIERDWAYVNDAGELVGATLDFGHRVPNYLREEWEGIA